ncbi:unnamed protein product [Owenia fusiformis]|uniref:Uncharacterized protein n=1 Tax=Owenia fusiformis TaxID=6347 RepID=A0A8J1XJQ2_OWEFU|nr:unnamed protein product [Owenia fusiformis]
MINMFRQLSNEITPKSEYKDDNNTQKCNRSNGERTDDDKLTIDDDLKEEATSRGSKRALVKRNSSLSSQGNSDCESMIMCPTQMMVFKIENGQVIPLVNRSDSFDATSNVPTTQTAIHQASNSKITSAAEVTSTPRAVERYFPSKAVNSPTILTEINEQDDEIEAGKDRKVAFAWTKTNGKTSLDASDSAIIGESLTQKSFGAIGNRFHRTSSQCTIQIKVQEAVIFSEDAPKRNKDSLISESASHNAPMVFTVSHQCENSAPVGLVQQPIQKSSASSAGSGDSNQEMCRICWEDGKKEKLVEPCRCCGTAGYIHPSCLHQWIIRKNSMTCELCWGRFEAYKTLKPIKQWRFPSLTRTNKAIIVSLIFLCMAITATIIGGLHLKDNEIPENEPYVSPMPSLFLQHLRSTTSTPLDKLAHNHDNTIKEKIHTTTESVKTTQNMISPRLEIPWESFVLTIIGMSCSLIYVLLLVLSCCHCGAIWRRWLALNQEIHFGKYGEQGSNRRFSRARIGQRERISIPVEIMANPVVLLNDGAMLQD